MYSKDKQIKEEQLKKVNLVFNDVCHETDEQMGFLRPHLREWVTQWGQLKKVNLALNDVCHEKDGQLGFLRLLPRVGDSSQVKSVTNCISDEVKYHEIFPNK